MDYFIAAENICSAGVYCICLRIVFVCIGLSAIFNTEEVEGIMPESLIGNLQYVNVGNIDRDNTKQIRWDNQINIQG